MSSPTHPLNVVICKGCGLVYVNPMYSNADKNAVSPVVRLLHRSRAAEQSRAAAFAGAVKRSARCMDLMRRYLTPGQAVLEIGSGEGAILWLLKQFGVRPMGIDLDCPTAEAAARALQVPVLGGAFEDVDLAGQQFGAIVVIHLIEHFVEPVAMLRKCRTLLQPGGMIFLETPNILRPKVGPGRVFSFAHNYHFSPRTMALALYRSGFRCTALREFRRDSFQIVAHAAERDQLGPAPEVHPWQAVARAVQHYRSRYLSSCQFLWRKLPWLKDWLMYQPRRDLAGAGLRQWLTPAPGNSQG
jgi:2-polyprenyl-3-methyl-5-hydroxy-6-metoxy-1,4-benzoquinol methylase